MNNDPLKDLYNLMDDAVSRLENMRKFPKTKKKTQRERLKEHLDSGKSITRLSAFNEIGIFELASRIGELEKEINEKHTNDN